METDVADYSVVLLLFIRGAVNNILNMSLI